MATTELEKTAQLKNVASTPENIYFFSFLACTAVQVGSGGALRRLVASGEKFLNETLMWIVVESWGA